MKEDVDLQAVVRIRAERPGTAQGGWPGEQKKKIDTVRVPRWAGPALEIRGRRAPACGRFLLTILLFGTHRHREVHGPKTETGLRVFFVRSVGKQWRGVKFWPHIGSADTGPRKIWRGGHPQRHPGRPFGSGIDSKNSAAAPWEKGGAQSTITMVGGLAARQTALSRWHGRDISGSRGKKLGAGHRKNIRSGRQTRIIPARLHLG